MLIIAADAAWFFLMWLRLIKPMPKITKPPSHPFTAHGHRCLRSCCGLFLALAWLAVSAAQAQTTNYTLGTTALVVGPAAGSSSVVLGVTPATGAWTAGANTNWLHLDPANQSGTGSTNVVFSYDANPGATRSGTLTIGDQTLTVTQAGSTYVAGGSLATLVWGYTLEVSGPGGLAVDGSGNVYISSMLGGAIKEWTIANNTVTTLAHACCGQLEMPFGVALDSAGNVYIASGAAIMEWTAANSNLIKLVSSGLAGPIGVAVDSSNNVYISDGDSTIKVWTAANSNLSTLVSSGLHSPCGIALDCAGSVYIADTGSNAIKKWTAGSGTMTTLVSSGLSAPYGVAADGAGNVYIADKNNNAVKVWTAANGAVTTLVSGLGSPGVVAVDGSGNVYIGDVLDNGIKELPYAFVDPTPKLEGMAAGNDALPVVLPTTANLLPPFAPTSDQSWLTVTGITNDVVSFSFTANPGPARTAHITLLGQTISITQGLIGTPPALTGAQMLGNGILQFAFTNTPGASFTVVSTANLSLPFTNWTAVGASTEISPGQFQFTSQPTTNDPQRFYGVRSP
jgi:sugar lactone lactonase YvrE